MIVWTAVVRPGCPVSAIYPVEHLPEKWEQFALVNDEKYAAKSTCPHLEAS